MQRCLRGGGGCACDLWSGRASERAASSRSRSKRDAALCVRRYRNLALKWHPLRCEDPDAQSNFDEVSEAFEVLTNYELRALFDKFGEIALKEGVSDGNGGTDCPQTPACSRSFCWLHAYLLRRPYRVPGRQLCVSVQRQ